MSQLKDPDYSLLVSPDGLLRERIARGLITGTIRTGHRDFRIGGRVLLACHLVPWAVQADIIYVRHTTIANVTAFEMDAAGYGIALDPKDLRRELGRYYPDLTIDSLVTTIRWKDVRGALVDAFKTA